MRSSLLPLTLPLLLALGLFAGCDDGDDTLPDVKLVTPASGGTGSTSKARIGERCESDDECASGTCLRADDGEAVLTVGTAPGGLCTAACSSSTECQALDAKAVCVTFAADSSYCVQSCSFGTAPLTEDKCASRAELSCQPLLLEGGPSCDDQPCPEPLVCLDGTCSILPACLPRCNSDSDCPADRYCDPRYGECVTERPDGKLPGETCDPNAAEDECRGNCVDFGGGIVECDENCTVGAPGGCGYADAATAPVACAFFAYDFGVDQGISDEGSCAARCRCNDECPGEQLCLPDTSGDAGLCVGGLALEDSLQECPEE
jgi:hypothetical protein